MREARPHARRLGVKPRIREPQCMAAPASERRGTFGWAMNLPARGPGGLVHMVVDTPKDSSNKYKYDAESGLFKLSRILPAGLHFPCDFGAIPGTLAADGDALDVALFAEHPTFPGCLVTVRLIGVVEAEQTEKGRTIRNDRLIAVPETPVNKAQVRRLRDLPKGFIEQVEQFFVGYNRAHGRQFKPLARRGKESAEHVLNAAIRLPDELRRHGERNGRRLRRHPNPHRSPSASRSAR
jgi:inorganic pyrophosphatase